MTNFLDQCGGFTPIPRALSQRYSGNVCLVWGIVWRYCQMSKGYCNASVDRMAEETDGSAKTFRRHLSTLIDAGLVEDKTPDIRNKPHTFCTKKGERIILEWSRELEKSNEVSQNVQPKVSEVGQNDQVEGDALGQNVQPKAVEAGQNVQVLGQNDQLRLDKMSNEETILRNNKKQTTTNSKELVFAKNIFAPFWEIINELHKSTVSEIKAAEIDDSQCAIVLAIERLRDKPRKGVIDWCADICSGDAKARQMTNALVEVCQIDMAIVDGKTRGLFKSAANKMAKTYEIQDVDKFSIWWYQHDWRGQAGQPPTLSNVREEWGKYRNHPNGYQNGAQRNGHHPKTTAVKRSSASVKTQTEIIRDQAADEKANYHVSKLNEALASLE